MLYTDGLIEDRRSTLHRGLSELCQAIQSAPTDDPENLVEHILTANVGPNPRSDDVAVLALTPVHSEFLTSRTNLRWPTAGTPSGDANSSTVGIPQVKTASLPVRCRRLAMPGARQKGRVHRSARWSAMSPGPPSMTWSSIIGVPWVGAADRQVTVMVLPDGGHAGRWTGGGLSMISSTAPGIASACASSGPDAASWTVCLGGQRGSRR
jgi:hypothetical protein